MTSQERHEARYQRRVARRQAKKAARLPFQGGYDELFSYDKLFNAFYECREGVRWKKSIQGYEATLPLVTFDIFSTLLYRQFKPYGFLQFYLMERGKKRFIRALKVKERCIQRVLCDQYLIPRIQPQLIYDNGASIKGKGTSFAISRMKTHLHRHFRRYGTDGYIFQYDFHSYFDNINHDKLIAMLNKVLEDKEVLKVTEQMIRCFGDKGLGLGSQVSQICAVWYPTIIDRYFKEVMGIQGYGRYNDDGYCICKDLKEAKACQAALISLCNQLDIEINEKKMRISRINNTFIFLKKRFKLTETGKIICMIDKSGVVRARRRLKKLAKRINTDEFGCLFTFLDFNQSYRSWIGAAKHYDNYKIVKSYEELYFNLLDGYDGFIKEKVGVKKRGKGYRIWSYLFYEKSETWSGWQARLFELSPSIT